MNEIILFRKLIFSQNYPLILGMCILSSGHYIMGIWIFDISIHILRKIMSNAQIMTRSSLGSIVAIIGKFDVNCTTNG